MNSIIASSRFAVAALLCGVSLAGCNAVEDVRSDPATQLPPERVVLEGTVYGLGIRRSIVVQNGTAADAPSRLIQGVVGEAIGPRGRETRFSFGALVDGSSYNVNIKPGFAPFGKNCIVNNGVGTLHFNASDPQKGAPQNIEVMCSNDATVNRYDIRVATPQAFRDALRPRITLTTEEGVFEADPNDTADGDPEYVWFRDALINVPATGVLPFQNIVKAYTETGSTAALKLINRCAVANHTFASPAGAAGADVTNVAVGGCTFTVGGTDTPGGAVRYSRPIGVTSDPAMGAGNLVLELRYPDGRPVPSTSGPATEVTISAFNSDFVFPAQVTSGAECPVTKQGEAPVPCEVRGFYEVTVKRHPDNQRCIVASSTIGLTGPLLQGNPTAPIAVGATANAIPNFGPAANLYRIDESIATGTFATSPSNYTGLRVWCRNLPLAGRELAGTYQMTNQEVFAGATSSSNTPWSPAYGARRQYSNVLTFFTDGTFLFGTHKDSDALGTAIVTSNHAEYGFYDYAPNVVLATPTDPNNVVAGNKIRFTIHVDPNLGTATPELASGISSAEGPRSVGTGAAGLRHQVLTQVAFGTGSPRTIRGRFGPDGSPATTAARVVDFAEAPSVNGQLTGSWVSQDQRRFWTYNADSTFAFHAGSNGFPNIQDTCFKMSDPTRSSGQYIPSPGGVNVYCNPVGSTQSNLSALAHSPPPLLQARIPGWKGWLPGGELGGGSTTRSPAPVYFQIAPAGSFASTTEEAIFPAASVGSTTWCPTEILGIRATQNGELADSKAPLYFCRHRAN
jgi:hypothetical protein